MHEDGRILRNPQEQEVQPQFDMSSHLARLCVQNAENIIEIIQRVSNTNTDFEWRNPRVSVFTNSHGRRIGVIGRPEVIRGIGDQLHGQHFINLDFDEGLRGEILESFGIDSAVRLSVSFHTDAETLPKVHEHVDNGGSSEFLYTDYYFDAEGRCVKAFQLPLDWDDSRPEVSRNEFYKTLKARMTPEDFELAGGVLEFIKEQVIGLERASNDDE